MAGEWILPFALLDGPEPGPADVVVGIIWLGITLHEAINGNAQKNTPEIVLESRGGKNRLPDSGEPGAIIFNPPGTTGRKYGLDGFPWQDWNKLHPGEGGLEGEQDHVHDWEPRPAGAKPGKGERKGARDLTPEEKAEWEKAKQKIPPAKNNEPNTSSGK